MTNYLHQGYKLNSPRGEYTIEAVLGRGATAIACSADRCIEQPKCRIRYRNPNSRRTAKRYKVNIHSRSLLS